MKIESITKVVNLPFDLMNNAKTDTNLRGNEHRVYIYLLSCAGNETAECFLLNSTIGKELGLHPDTVRRVINRLVTKGYVLKQMVKQKHTNNNSANKYTLCKMLDQHSLDIKKKLVELFPVVKKGVDTLESMMKVVLEKLDEVKEEVVEKVEDTKETVKEMVQTVAEKVFKPSFKPNFECPKEEEVAEEPTVVPEKTQNKFAEFMIDRAEQIRRNIIAFREQVESSSWLRSEVEAKSLMPLANEYGIIINLEQMTSLVDRYGISAVKNGLDRAFVIELKHYNYIKKYLADKYR